jgi:hypothetical protein
MDLTKPENVKALMASSKSKTEWGENCNKVKAANGNRYPSWWYAEIEASGLATQTQVKWEARR